MRAMQLTVQKLTEELRQRDANLTALHLLKQQAAVEAQAPNEQASHSWDTGFHADRMEMFHSPTEAGPKKLWIGTPTTLL